MLLLERAKPNCLEWPLDLECYRASKHRLTILHYSFDFLLPLQKQLVAASQQQAEFVVWSQAYCTAYAVSKFQLVVQFYTCVARDAGCPPPPNRSASRLSHRLCLRFRELRCCAGLHRSKCLVLAQLWKDLWLPHVYRRWLWHDCWEDQRSLHFSAEPFCTWGDRLQWCYYGDWLLCT